MRKYIIFSIISIIVGIGSSYINGVFTTSAAQLPQEKIAIVQKAVKEFRAEKQWKGTCTIDGTQVSLEAVILGKIANESSYGTKGVGGRTNNWGNIHGDLIGTAAKFIRADNSGTYPVYNTPEEGVKNIAMWLIKKDCAITFNSTFAYVKGPKAPRTDANVKAITTYLANMKSVAMAYESNKTLSIVENAESKKAEAMILGNGVKDGCYHVKSVRNADYIQIDQGGQELTRVKVEGDPNKKIDVFNCYGQ